MLERVVTQYENILGLIIYSDDNKSSIWDVLKFFSIMFLVAALVTVVLTADLIKGDLSYLVIIYTIIIGVEGICFVALAYYANFWDDTRSNPVIHENGLLVPPETVRDSINGIWKPYMASKITGIYPEFVLRERKSDSDYYFEFQRLIIKFIDDRECRVKTTWDGEFVKALDRMLKGTLAEHVKSSKDYFNFNSYNSEKIDELFYRSGPMLKQWKNNVYNGVILIVMLTGFAMAFVIPALLTMAFPGHDDLYLVLMIPILVTCFGVPYFHFFSRTIDASEKIIILLHLIEYDEMNKGGLIPPKYQEQVELVKSKMAWIRRTDREILAKLKGLNYPAPKRTSHSIRLSKINKEVIDLNGEKIVYYENSTQKSLRSLSKYSIVFLPFTILIQFFLWYMVDLNDTIWQCCSIFIVIGIVGAVGLPAFFYSKIGFSKTGIHPVNQAYPFTRSKERIIKFEDISKVNSSKRQDNIAADQFILQNNDTILLNGIDDILQIEIFQRYERYKKSRVVEGELKSEI